MSGIDVLAKSSQTPTLERDDGEVTDSAPRPIPHLSGHSIELLGLALAIGLLVAATLARRLSTDVFWTLAAGESILRHRSLFGTNAFTYTEPHRRWVADEWGSEVLLASFYKVFGAWAFNVFAVVTGVLCLLATRAYGRALGASGGRVAALLVLLAFGIAPVITQDRALSLSLIWLPLELLFLTKGRSDPRWLWALPPLFLCWVNTHGSILLGLFILGIELALSLAPRRWMGGVERSPHPRQLALVAVVGLLASCLSPYGPGLLRYDLGVTSDGQISQYISEWQSPDFHSLEMLLFYGIPLVVIFLAFRSRRPMTLELVLTILFFFGALRSGRFVEYLFVATCGLVACLPPRPAWGPRARRMTGALAIALALATLAAPAVPAGSVTSDTPVQAFNYLAQRPGRIFTEQAWASYGILRHRASFFDGRADYFSGAVFADYIAIDGVSVDPDPILSRYDVKYVLWQPGTPLYNYLIQDPKWKVLDRAGQAVIFVRRSS